jgi:protein TonB
MFKNLILLPACLFIAAMSRAQQNTDGTTGTPAKDIYHYVERMPATDYSLSDYLSQNTHYPDSARWHNIEGRVIAKFVVNEDGTISNCTITKGVDPYCDAEALRVIKAMPKWKPGTQDGKPVKVYFTLPIVFKLED